MCLFHSWENHSTKGYLSGYTIVWGQLRKCQKCGLKQANVSIQGPSATHSGGTQWITINNAQYQHLLGLINDEKKFLLELDALQGLFTNDGRLGLYESIESSKQKEQAIASGLQHFEEKNEELGLTESEKLRNEFKNRRL